VCGCFCVSESVCGCECMGVFVRVFGWCVC
jgi:hypothetical protein